MRMFGDTLSYAVRLGLAVVLRIGLVLVCVERC